MIIDILTRERQKRDMFMIAWRREVEGRGRGDGDREMRLFAIGSKALHFSQRLIHSSRLLGNTVRGSELLL